MSNLLPGKFAEAVHFGHRQLDDILSVLTILAQMEQHEFGNIAESEVRPLAVEVMTWPAPQLMAEWQARGAAVFDENGEIKGAAALRDLYIFQAAVHFAFVGKKRQMAAHAPPTIVSAGGAALRGLERPGK